jgi:REP element-mobilizing transposase RayT
MKLETLFENFDLFADAPDAVAKMQSAGTAGLRTRKENASTEPRDPSTKPRGWHSRGYLPHFDSHDVIQHVTFHLADSLPKETVEKLFAEIQQLDPDRQEIEKRRRLEALGDAGLGACWLRRSDCARVVQDALLHFDGERYRMIAWVVMPNHVHALFQTMEGWSMNAVVGSWKTFTANAIGRIVRQPNEPVPHVWHPEFWDRFIRNESHLTAALAYIHNNPVKAGLVSHPEDWPWSSAGSAGLRTRKENASTEPRDPGTEPRVPPPRTCSPPSWRN